MVECFKMCKGVNLRLSWWRQEVKILHQTSNSNTKDWQCKDDSGAASLSDSEREVTEVIPVGFDLGLLYQEPLGPKLLGVLPVRGVVG
ncbi:hypothetical protein Dsin_006353 [Dipteronia sinensis]|uniref:Uncharacterized protein n=1 Tax=Dipteronia sinensis TaxID=43782 RepID=A0AAE0EFJ7_9ROSI|nr:hypothetical protein Dsin_006353 [Dipteronia sinensis]